MLERISVLETGYTESIQNAEIRKGVDIQNAQQRAESARMRCKSVFQSSSIALQNCRQGIIQSIIGNGVCDNREELINQRFGMCNRNAEVNLQNGLVRADSNYLKNSSKAKLRFDSRLATQNAKLQRLKERLSEAQQSLTTCTVK